MSNSDIEQPKYGYKDQSFLAAGSEVGIRKLVDDFYDIMSEDANYAEILSWHPEDLRVSRDKLARFLCGWLGGPRRYQEKYGAISIPMSHEHLRVSFEQRDRWLSCMSQAVERQPYAGSFKQYLMKELAVPAEAIRRTCEKNVVASQ